MKSLLLVLTLVVMFALVGQARAVDVDGDGVEDGSDLCIPTPAGHAVDPNGCSDTDGDGVYGYIDACLDTDAGAPVDAEGCELDSDNDGILDSNDLCPGTRRLSAANADGCLDPDGDGVYDPCDVCPGTPAGHTPDPNGCSDDDGDGIYGYIDNCPDDSNPGQEDVVDGDGAGDICDICPQTDPLWNVSAEGCADRDEDGVSDYKDRCWGTDTRVPMGIDGCRATRWFAVEMSLTAEYFYNASPWQWDTHSELDNPYLVDYPVESSDLVNSAELVWDQGEAGETKVWFRVYDDGSVGIWDQAMIDTYDPGASGKSGYDWDPGNPTEPCSIVTWNYAGGPTDPCITITIYEVFDTDSDGIVDAYDSCPTTTPLFAPIDATGCALPDADGDLIPDADDLCPGSNLSFAVDQDGCLDTDVDGVPDTADNCGSSPLGATVSIEGCTDADGDGVYVPYDKCEGQGSPVNAEGCTDTDGDGVADTDDQCNDPCTWVAANGCPDADRDGVANGDDLCNDPCTWVGVNGCPDTDGDGITDANDSCSGTPPADTVDGSGCTVADADGDGIPDVDDDCDDTPSGRPIDEKGCHWKKVRITTSSPPWQFPVIWDPVQWAENPPVVGGVNHNNEGWPFDSYVFDILAEDYGVPPIGGANYMGFGDGSGSTDLTAYFRVYVDGKCQVWDQYDLPYWRKLHKRPGGCPLSGSTADISGREFDYTVGTWPNGKFTRCWHPTTTTRITADEGAPPTYPGPITIKAVEDIDSDGDGVEDPLDECPTLPVDPNLSLVDEVGCPIWPECDDPWRPSSAGDVTGDCYVNEDDVLKMSVQWLQCTHPLVAGCTQLQLSPEELEPNVLYMKHVPDGTITVNGQLTEAAWLGSDPCWIDLTRSYWQDACDVVSAKYALYWSGNATDPCMLIYAAVKVIDNDHVLKPATNWNQSDRIEIYVQGDPNGPNEDGGDVWGVNSPGTRFDKAQQYAVGEKGPGFFGIDWGVFGNGAPIPGVGSFNDAGFKYNVRFTGAELRYEIQAKPWVWYGGSAPVGPSEIRRLEPGMQIGFDIIVGSRYGSLLSSDPGYDGDYGMLSANLAIDKYKYAKNFQRWELKNYDGTNVPPECGDWGYLKSDVLRDSDCEVTLADFAVVSNEWMDCTDPCAPCGYDPFAP